ncbi:MAG TPA: hypothetical protein DHW40_08585, partial [Microbacterium sp.]|nr:hypothetical protein [Microbacterium sp.]
MFEGRFDQALTEHLGHIPLSRGGAWIEQLVVDVPPEWTASPDALPRDFLRAAVGAGAYLDLSCTTMFDLWSLDDLLPEIRGIRFDWETDSFTGFSALAAMDRLEYLWSGEVSEAIDLSHLQHLREAIIGGPGLLSVLRAPNLATLSLDVATLDPDFRIPRTLREFSFSTGTIEAAHLSEAVALERIMLSEIDGVDFGGLPPSHILQRAWVTAAKYVKGLEAIAAAPSMREIRLIRVSSIDSVDSLVDSLVEHAEITGCPDVDERVSRRLERRGWHVQPFRRRRSANVLTVESGGDGTFEVVFADWAVLSDR